jgi:hypothetical protein
MSDLERLRKLLIKREDEILEIKIAISVLERLHSTPEPETDERTLPLITVSRPRQPKKIATPDRERATRDRNAIVDLVRSAGKPLRAGEIVKPLAKTFHYKNKSQTDRIYWALKDLRHKGLLAYDNEGQYTLPGNHP